MIAMTGNKKQSTPKKFFDGKPCPDPLKGEICPLCGASYICKAKPAPSAASDAEQGKK